MQSQNNHFAGHQNPDTQKFDDSSLLSQYRGAPHKIQELAVAFNDKTVVGISAVYRVLGHNQSVSGGKHFGGLLSGARTEVLKLDDNEYVTEISGKGGNVVDSIKITTSTGRSVEHGGPGGNPFSLRAPYGQHFATLRGGLGGDLHFLDLVAEPLPQFGGYQAYQVQEDQFFKGKRNPDTRTFSDVELLKSYGGQHKIQNLHVYHDGNCVVGLQAEYYVYGPNKTIQGPKDVGTANITGQGQLQLEADEFITEIYGRHGDVVDFIGFKTNKGNKSEFGGKGGHNHFELKAPHGRHFAVLRGGLGGHIHFIDFAIEPMFQQPKQFQQAEFRKGKVNPDTANFSDEALLKNYPPTHKIWKLSVFHDRSKVSGLKATYFVFGPNVVVEGGRHVGAQWNNAVEDVVELSADEYIVEIFGRHGNIIDNLGFVTNKGRKFDFGGNGGNQFETKAPQGYHFATLAGGMGGDIHNVEFALLPLPQTKWW